MVGCRDLEKILKDQYRFNTVNLLIIEIDPNAYYVTTSKSDPK